MQDLTRLKVPVTYLKHMFEEAFKERLHQGTKFMTSFSSFDHETQKEKHRDSVGR